MKLHKEHYEHMLNAMRPLADRLMAHRIYLQSKGNIKDIEKQLRWDAMYGAGLTKWVCDNVYSYCNDNHIDTALRSIISELEATK